MRALVRSVPTSYDRCLRSRPVAIDVPRARAQHQAYVNALRAAGVEVVFAPPLDDAPDSVFVEDTAVVFDRAVVITRPGAPSRQLETESIAPAPPRPEILEMPAPATLDGGDVLRVGGYLFVGRSARSNREGLEFLAAVAARENIETVEVEVEAALHLKSLCSRFGEKVIGRFDRLPREPFLSRGLQLIDAPEEHGANVLELGENVLVSALAQKTAELGGARTICVDVSEFHKGDGALTCMSILF